MPSKPSELSPLLAVLAIALSLGTAGGQAQRGSNNPLPVTPTPAAPRGLPTKPNAAAANQHLSPFDRVIAPEIAALLKGKKQVTPGSASPKASSGFAAGFNFPGFASTPFLTLNDGSSSEIANSVTGDFNHDGKPDVAIVRLDGTIDVILNPGPGIASQTPIVSNPGNTFGFNIVDVAVADMNGDGIPDLVGQDSNSSQIVVWISKGDGTFSAPHDYSSKYSNATLDINSMLVGDFNRDGTIDVVTLTYLIGPNFSIPTTTIVVQTFLNDGSGALDPLPEQDTVFHDIYTQQIGNATVTSSDGVTATGIAFLLTDSGFSNGFNSANEVIAISSNGNGTFSSPVEPTVGVVPQDIAISVYGGMIATNLSAKGPGQPTTDIVFITGDGAVWDAPFTSANPTSAHILVGADFYPGILNGLGQAPPTSVNNTPQFWQTSLGVADMNGDGLQDLVVYMSNGIAVYPNAGSGVFSAVPTQMESDRSIVRQPQPADYDGSGYNSLVSVDLLLGQVGYIQNLGAAGSPATGQFVSGSVVTGINSSNQNAELLGSNFQILATADINGDGILDVIGLDESNANSLIPPIVVGLSNGSAPGNQTSNFTFTTVDNPALTDLPIGFIEPATISNAAGTSIIVISIQAPFLYLVTVAKDGTAGASQALDLGGADPASLGTCFMSYADTGDINGDGIPDIVVACGGAGNAASGYYTLLGNPDGTFQTATFTPLGTNLYMVKLINLTGAADKLDLVAFESDFTSYTNPGLDLWVIPNKGDGSGSFDLTRYTQPVTNSVLTAIVVGDFNADGKQDLTLLTQGHWNPLTESLDANTAGALLLPGNGDYTFGNPTLVATNTYPLSGAYADFNGDGLPDLALNVFIDNITPYSYEAAPLAQVLPNLGGGSFGAPIIQFHSVGTVNYDLLTTFAGPFTKSGGPDLLIGSDYGAALYINRGVTTLDLTASSTTPGQGVPVTFTATISQVVNADAAPTGVVLFTSNGTTIGSAVPANGVAIFTTEQLPVGVDAVTAAFAGDANHNQSSASVTVTVAPVLPSFTLSSATPSLSLAQGANGSVLVTVAGNSTFSGAVQLTCTGAPVEVSCTASPASITLTPGQSSSASIVIATTPPNNTNQAHSRDPLGGTLGGIALGGLAFLIWPRRRRLPRMLSVLAFAALALTSFGALSGCSGSGNKYPGTVVGNYTLTVTGVSGGITETQTIALSVTQPAQ